MPPKKKEVEVEKPPLGRFKSHLKIGIVGLPNVGKSSLFNTLTKCSIPAENFPFCTIQPNEARVNIPDDRFNWLVDLYKPKSEVPAFLDVWDIAGLVKGAAEGAGLGNDFLSNINATDGIFHVCRAFDDADVIHVEDRVDPVDDLDIIHNELRQKDIAFIEKIHEGLTKQISRGLKKEQKEELATAQKCLDWLNSGKDIRMCKDWTVKDIDYLNEWLPLSAKPVCYLVNLTQKDYIRKKNKWLAKIHAWVQENAGGAPIIPFSATLETELVDLPDDQAREEHLKELGCVSALPKIVKTGFSVLQLIYFFTAGADEVKCWTIRQGTKAPGAAGTIHTDFETGFICAEIMKYEDLKEAGSENAVKAAGKYKQQGKTYVVNDGDICHFQFNVTTQKKK